MPQQTVNIRIEGNQIKLNFIYNTDLVDIMHDHKGWFFYKEKAWVFPASKLGELRDELKRKMYIVKIIKDEGQRTIPERKAPVNRTLDDNVWNDKEVLFVAGKCKKCGQYGFIGKSGLCVRCK